ncbi:unnamed protein product [Clonostachys chloroleuca]|uniref:MYND-type domain-containing protein n=1 Tax=Clonostachys chloroleuca TaxID=1926264 RepID=A0AA35PZD9_9HYPO|nr:unnamed protein product [Clonostachys chloroleuca]
MGSICTRYCSESCQKQHWSLHKPVCRDRRRLSRAVRLLSEVWDAFYTLTYEGFLTYTVEKHGFISSEDETDTLEDLVWTGGTIVRDFHRDVVPHGADEAVPNLAGTKRCMSRMSIFSIVPPITILRSLEVGPSYELRGQICRTAGAVLKEFLVLKHTGVLSLLSTLDAEAFSAQKLELVNRAISSIEETIHEITVVQGKGRWYVELKMVAPGKFATDRKVVDQESIAKKIAKAYFTPEEIKNLRSLTLGNPERLQETLVQGAYHRQKKHSCLGHEWRTMETSSVRRTASVAGH